MVVAEFFVRWIERWIPFLVFDLVLYVEAAHHGLRAHRTVLLVHGDDNSHVLLAYWLRWILCMPLVCAEDIRCY